MQQAHPTSADYLYFSFITRLTVGYGDLTAASDPGRACAVLDALVGQLYLVTSSPYWFPDSLPARPRPSTPSA